MTSLIVLTCPRGDGDGFAYLRELAKQLDAEAVPFDVVVDNSADERLPMGLPSPGRFHDFRRPGGSLKGNKLAYWRCIDLARELGGDVVILEDDVELCANAARRMLTLPVPPDLALVQFFSPDVLTAQKTFPGLWRPPRADFTFTQAVKFPRRTIDQLVAWKDDPRFVQYISSDQALALWLRSSGLRFGVHAPELVQHVGELSAIEEQSLAWRTSKTWPGRDFDAMSLYVRDDLYR